MTIQWFPGHMAKTRKLMTDNLKLVDVVIEMLDARLPFSSRNPLINDLIGAKPRVLIMAKADLAEEDYNKSWAAYFRRQGMSAVACDLKGPNARTEMKAVIAGLRSQTSEIISKRQKRGIKSRVIRTMVTGIPNAGKSTLINLLSGKASAETADRPGVTRGKQWVRLEQDLELLDMPGILWPNLEDREGARKLAVTGAIGDNAYDHLELALWLIAWMRTHRPGRITGRYGVAESEQDTEIAKILEEWRDAIDDGADDTDDTDEWERTIDTECPDEQEDVLSLAILEIIGRKRGFLRKGGVVEREKTAIMLLDELRGGRLGRVTWDEIPTDEEEKPHTEDETPQEEDETSQVEDETSQFALSQKEADS